MRFTTTPMMWTHRWCRKEETTVELPAPTLAVSYSQIDITTIEHEIGWMSCVCDIDYTKVSPIVHHQKHVCVHIVYICMSRYYCTCVCVKALLVRALYSLFVHKKGFSLFVL